MMKRWSFYPNILLEKAKSMPIGNRARQVQISRCIQRKFINYWDCKDIACKKLMQTDVNMQISYLLFTLFPHLMYLFYYHMKREKDIIFSFSSFFSLKIRTSVTLFAFGHYVENYILAFVVFFLSCFFFLADFFLAG